MDTLSILLIALSLSMDCFAIAVGISCSRKKVPLIASLKVVVAFGIAQAVMTVIGWLAGRSLINIISAYDHWVVFGLMLLVGAHMIWESFHDEEEGGKLDLTRGWALISLSVITSIDALATGLALALQEVNIAVAAVVIGTVTFLVVIAGFVIGRKVGEILGRWAGVLGGLILIVIGTRVLIEHLSG
jgi:manganese efflux pump family protein